MSENDVKKIVYDSFKTPEQLFWIIVRLISATRVLVITYVFSKGIEAIETGKNFEDVIRIFALYLFIEFIEHILRISSKTRLATYNERSLLKIHGDLGTHISPKSKQREEAVQTMRNLTQAIRKLIEYMLNNGIPGIVSFATIPIVLYFIDTRVFVLQIILSALYLIITYVVSKKYEKSYEDFDASRESYFSELLNRKWTKELAESVVEKFKKVQDVRFFGWLTLQNLISVFYFIAIYFVVSDVFNGDKQISDLVLIAGYTKEAKVFLNELTMLANISMEVRAGIERVVSVFSNESLATHRS